MATAEQAETYDGSTPLGNARHETFAHEYVTDSNGAQAAERAGYSPKGARQQASTLLTNPNVWARVAYLRDERLKKSRRSAAEIIKELENVAFSNVSDTMTWNESGACFVKNSDDLPRDVSAAIESIQVEEKAIGKESDESMILKTKVKLHPKLPALLALGKEHGLFRDKVDHQHSGSVAHTVEVVNYGDKEGEK
jgi:phage terminase small subunit